EPVYQKCQQIHSRERSQRHRVPRRAAQTDECELTSGTDPAFQHKNASPGQALCDASDGSERLWRQISDASIATTRPPRGFAHIDCRRSTQYLPVNGARRQLDGRAAHRSLKDDIHAWQIVTELRIQFARIVNRTRPETLRLFVYNHLRKGWSHYAGVRH